MRNRNTLTMNYRISIDKVLEANVSYMNSKFSKIEEYVSKVYLQKDIKNYYYEAFENNTEEAQTLKDVKDLLILEIQ